MTDDTSGICRHCGERVRLSHKKGMWATDDTGSVAFPITCQQRSDGGDLHEPMSPAQQFFYEYAGSSYSPPTETKTEGRLRGSRELAEAEAQAEALGWQVFTGPDPEGPMEDDAGSVELVASGKALCLTVILADATEFNTETFTSHVPILGTVGSVIVPSEDDPYIRVLAAELAMDALAEQGVTL